MMQLARRVSSQSAKVASPLAGMIARSFHEDQFFKFENDIVTAGHSTAHYTSKSTEVPTSYADDCKIIGASTQVVRFELGPNQAVRCEPHSMLWMDSDVELQTTVGEDWWSGISRKLSGGPLFVTDYVNTSRKHNKVLVLGAQYPARVLPFDMAEYGGSIKASSAAFLAGPPDVTVSAMTPPSLAASLFGGAGVLMQHITAGGVVFLHAGGAVAKRRLLPHEELVVNPGCILAMEEGVAYDVKMVSGVSNVLFGQGLFVATLRGPGTVWLQALPWSTVEHRILAKARSMHHSSSSSTSSSSSSSTSGYDS